MDVLQQQIGPIRFQKLLEANLDSLNSILIRTEVALCQLTKLNLEEVKSILNVAAEIKLSHKIKPSSEIPAWSRFTTGTSDIDELLHGGIPTDGITEIVGASGVGKTQFCLQLLLTIQFPIESGGQNKGAVYICTEDVFPTKRLNQLAKTFSLLYSDLDPIKFNDNIFIEHITDYEQLRRCLYVNLPKLLQMRNIGLIVIDSIAGLFRSENLNVNYSNRGQEFLMISSQLNKLAQKYNLAVVCTNQITDNLDNGNSEPCLGLSWSNLVTCRFRLVRLWDAKRIIEVVFAPDLPNLNCKFFIQECGLTNVKS